MEVSHRKKNSENSATNYNSMPVYTQDYKREFVYSDFPSVYV